MKLATSYSKIYVPVIICQETIWTYQQIPFYVTYVGLYPKQLYVVAYIHVLVIPSTHSKHT